MRVLLIKMSSLGDVIHALPAVTDAAANGVTFDWVVEEAFADIADAHPAVERVIPIAWRRWRKSLNGSRPQMMQWWRVLRSEQYDLVIDSQGLIKSALVGLMCRGPVSGFSHTSAREPWASFAYRRGIRVDRAQHAIDRQRQLFASALGYDLPVQAQSGLESKDQTQHSATSEVMLLHGTTWESKHYPVSMWQELARLVAADGFQPLVTWGNEQERARAQSIAQASGATVVPKSALSDLSSRLSSSALVIGVDSGLAHLSAALGVPTLGLFGPTDGHLTGCRGLRADHMQGQTPCSPCVSKSCVAYTGEPMQWHGKLIEPACFAALPPEQVWAAGKGLIDAHRV